MEEVENLIPQLTSKEIIKKLEEVVDLGYKVVIWNNRRVKELKDIKEGILLNWRNNLEPTDKGEAGTEIELFSFKNRRFKLLHSN